MVSVDYSESIARMNGAGRADLAEAVASHRTARRWTQAATAMRAGFSPGTLKNVEGKRTDLLSSTLAGLDVAFGWPPGTAEAILIDRAPVPPLPSRQPAHAGGLPRRLQAEMVGEMYDVRTVELSTEGHLRLVLTVVGDDDADLDAIREALRQVADLEHDLREHS